jgi:hypothetical protein
MKTLLLSCACAVLVSAPVLACRGTAEYPEVSAQLAVSNLPAAEKEALTKKFREGEALHHRGHDLDDAGLRLESLKILDEIKVKITR